MRVVGVLYYHGILWVCCFVSCKVEWSGTISVCRRVQRQSHGYTIGNVRQAQKTFLCCIISFLFFIATTAECEVQMEGVQVTVYVSECVYYRSVRALS